MVIRSVTPRQVDYGVGNDAADVDESGAPAADGRHVSTGRAGRGTRGDDGHDDHEQKKTAAYVPRMMPDVVTTQRPVDIYWLKKTVWGALMKISHRFSSASIFRVFSLDL